MRLPSLPSLTRRPRRRAADALERITTHLRRAMEQALLTEAGHAQPGLLQGLDPRAKLVGLLALIVAAASSPGPAVVYGLLAVGILLAMASHCGPRSTLARVWVGVLSITALLALPAIFLVPGEVIAHLPVVGWPITRQGVQSFILMTGRTFACATFATLLATTTPWPQILKALRLLGCPAVFIAILNMAYRYLFLLLDAALDLLLARRSRLVRRPPRALARRLAIDSLAVLVRRTLFLTEEVHLAMLSRGYRGRDLTLQPLSFHPRDWVAVTAFVALAGAAAWAGHG